MDMMTNGKGKGDLAMFDYRMETFLKVCDTLNYTKAAQELAITQPAVSQHIHYLEKYYDTRLFEVNGKQVSITPAGKMLKDTVKVFVNDESRMKEKIKKASNEESPLRMGATITIGEFVLAKPLALYMRKHPKQNIKLTIANTEDLINGLAEGTLDFAIVEGYFDSSEYEHMLIKTERFIPVCAVGETDDILKKGQIEELFEKRLLIREEGSGTREIFEKSLELYNHHLTEFACRTELNSMYAIVKLLKEGGCISFLYESAVKEAIKMGELVEIPIDGYSVEHEFNFIWQKGSIYKKDFLKFGDMVKDNL